jgi:hypothetical protein
MGFYTTRFVEASDSERAAQLALEMIRTDPKLTDRLLNSAEDLPIVSADEIEEAAELRRTTGYVFYPETTSQCSSSIADDQSVAE